MISVENKKDYLDALRLAPALIKAESDPIKFLRSEDFNPWTSAMTFVKYWEYRKRFFGSRWLLPMNDTGAGSLDQDDIKLLRKGWLTFVAPRDSSQGRFLLVDHGRIGDHTHQSRLRVVFYLCSVPSDIPAQTVGMTVVRLIPIKTEDAFTAPRISNATTVFRMMKEALPLRLRHVCFLKLAENDRGQILSAFLGRVSCTLFELLGKQTPFTVPITRVNQAAEKLAEFGVPPCVLPHSHGGTWSYEQMLAWKKAVCEEDDIGKQVKVPWIAETRPPPSEREVNALYARRAYEKRKTKRAADEATVKRLRVENERLRQDNEFLESLLEKAKDVAELFKQDLWG